MSVTTEELNYLIWRYLQETGLEISAFALCDETTVSQFDQKYKDSIPIGSLVNLVQKGILYAETDNLVKFNGQIQDDKFYKEKFSLFHALSSDRTINSDIEPKGRFDLVNGDHMDVTTENSTVNDDMDTDTANGTKEDSPEFIKVLNKELSLGPSAASSWHPSENSVLAYGLQDSTAKILILASEKKEITLHHPIPFTSTENSTSEITVVSWAPLGQFLVTAIESGEIRLWTADGKLRNVLYLHHSPVIFVRWSPDGKHIITSDADNATIVWDVNSGNVIQHLDLLNINELQASATAGSSTSGVSSIHPVPSLAAVNPNQGIINPGVQQSNKNDPSQHTILGTDAVWIEDNKFVIAGLNGSALVFNVGDRIPLGTLIGHTKSLSFLRFNPENLLLLTASDDRTLRIWNGSSFNNSQIFLGHSQPITFAEWISKDFVISCSLDSSIRIWDVKIGRQTSITILDGIPILIAALSPDKSKLVVGTTEGIISVIRIDVQSENQLKDIAEYQPVVEKQENFITSLSWSADSRKFLATYPRSESVVVALVDS